MKREVKVPKWGLVLESVVITEWLKQVGDQVREGEPICVVETDKATAEIKAPYGGVLAELRSTVGSECAIGHTIAVIATD